ncbi:Serine/Threonine kinase domain protein (macronuclear) [Tetrahymena thermophila SB210]|uniref:Serine/Threonine kinase domain protein n=1 Tax=Tetrahymena thermophila (strain SB210) TaxID=312017 RepID=I7LV91_TETTS|nr:Serine/Threonine kinase domain protein [Tetrahymena thermophila SB210]EAR97475.1 Serine/Threonine kinase domain protein [Tetrahymena thermophila SB210]|eukprot:XP_001017720.1 Serine/Threonine kinase domain protein [Tetrahymena thermophila SB210]
MSSSQLQSQNQNSGGNQNGMQNNSVKQTVYKKIGPYSLIKEIGQGSFARVYRGRTETNGVQEDFAIKMISKGYLREDNQELIDKEISILLKLRHKNIIRLVDFKKTTNNWYLIFEYCELGDLEQYMKEKFNGKFPLSIALTFIQQLKSAFQEIRRLKFVHRDLKLANILLTKDLTVKLGDFGFAKHFDDNSLLQSYCGTPITMAPEILKREKYNEKCDIWSLGIIIYQMIYGRPPFNPHKGAHIQDLINLIEKNQIDFSAIQIPPEVKDLILKMLVVDPNQRISFEDFFEHPCMQPQYLLNLAQEGLSALKTNQNQSQLLLQFQQLQQQNLDSQQTSPQDAPENQAKEKVLANKGIEINNNQTNQTDSEKLIQLSPKMQKMQINLQSEELLEVKEKQNRALEYIWQRMHEILTEELNKYLEKMDDQMKNAEQLSQDISTDFSQSCSWASVLLALLQTVKTIENHLEITLIISDSSNGSEKQQKEETFKIAFPKFIQEKLKDLSKQLNTMIKNIKIENSEQQKNTDVYNMLFGNLLHYADYSLLNEVLTSPQQQLKYYQRCIKLCQQLLSVKDNAFSKIVITINDPSMEITKQDIQKIIQLPFKDKEEQPIRKNSNSKNERKIISIVKNLINIQKIYTISNFLEQMNIVEKTEELKTQYEIYQGRYDACYQKISQQS